MELGAGFLEEMVEPVVQPLLVLRLRPAARLDQVQRGVEAGGVPSYLPDHDRYRGIKQAQYDIQTIFIKPIPEQHRAVREILAADRPDAVLVDHPGSLGRYRSMVRICRLVGDPTAPNSRSSSNHSS